MENTIMNTSTSTSTTNATMKQGTKRERMNALINLYNALIEIASSGYDANIAKMTAYEAFFKTACDIHAIAENERNSPFEFLIESIVYKYDKADTNTVHFKVYQTSRLLRNMVKHSAVVCDVEKREPKEVKERAKKAPMTPEQKAQGELYRAFKTIAKDEFNRTHSVEEEFIFPTFPEWLKARAA